MRYPKPIIREPKPKYTEVWQFTRGGKVGDIVSGSFRQGKLMTKLDLEYNGEKIDVYINGHKQKSFACVIRSESDAIRAVKYISDNLNNDGMIAGDLGAGLFKSTSTIKSNPSAVRFVKDMIDMK